jgi:predicted N-acetyltransferase YhbS
VITIRPATPADAPIIHAIIQAAFAEYIGTIPVPPGALAETLPEVEAAVAAGCVFVAWDGAQAVGTARYDVEPDCLYVGRVAVLPGHRGRRVGAALMVHLEELAPSLGRTVLRLGTRQSMPGNLAFYSRLGYRITATEPHSRGPDVVVWFEKAVEKAPPAAGGHASGEKV